MVSVRHVAAVGHCLAGVGDLHTGHAREVAPAVRSSLGRQTLSDREPSARARRQHDSCDELPASYLERYAAALSLNRNLAVFAKYDPTSVARSKSRRAPRTV